MQKIATIMLLQASFLFTSMSFTAPVYNNSSLINKKQATNYINQVIDSLFNTKSIAYNRDLEQFRNTTRDSLLNTLGFYPSYHAQAHMYNTRDLREGILGQATLFVERKARDYAHAQVRQLELPDYVVDRVLVKKVVDRIRGSLVSQLSSTSDQAGILSKYIGSALKERVNKIMSDEIRKPQPVKPAPVKKAPVQYEYTNDEYDEDADDHVPVRKTRTYQPAQTVVQPVVQPVIQPIVQPVVQPVMPYAPYGYAVEVFDVYEPAVSYAPCYVPTYPCAPGLSIGAGFPIGNGFLDFQFNL